MRRGDNRPGLLSDGEIRHFAEHHKMIREFEPKQLRPAAYDLRVATDGLVTPEGETYKPAFLPDGRRYDGGIALMPGDTAEFSSREQFDMPPNVAGNISIKTDLARRG